MKRLAGLVVVGVVLGVIFGVAKRDHDREPEHSTDESQPITRPIPPPPIETAPVVAEINQLDAGVVVADDCDDADAVTVAGKAREHWAEAVTEGLGAGDPIADWDNGATLATGGCEATTLIIGFGAHSGYGCDEKGLRGFEHDMRARLKKQGFKRLSCGGSDGPNVPIR